MTHRIPTVLVGLAVLALAAPASSIGAAKGPTSSPSSPVVQRARNRMRNVIGMMPSGTSSNASPAPFGPPPLGSWIPNTLPSIQSGNVPGCPHNEMTVAANPANSMNWITGANAYHASAGSCPTYPPTSTIDSFTGYYYTLDKGATWNGANFTNTNYISPTGVFTEVIPSGDPAVAFDSTGRAVFTELAANDPGDQGGVYAHLSTDGGATWAITPTAVVNDNSATIFNDKPYVAVDTSATSVYKDRMYVCWTKFDFTTGISPIHVKYSTDHGNTWIGDTALETSIPENFDQFCNPATASTGIVYIAYQVSPSFTGIAPQYSKIASSSNGGVTWSTPITADNGISVTLTGAIGDDGRQYLQATINGYLCFRHDDYPVIGVDPANPSHVYKVWTDGRWQSTQPALNCQGVTTSPGKHADIAFDYSTDGGVTWSTPVRINDDYSTLPNGLDHFMPWMSVGSDGVIHVSWLDRRDDPNNVFYNTYYSQSSDGGLTWTINQKVSDAPSDPSRVLFGGLTVGFIGDYQGNATLGSTTLAAWTDMRASMPGCAICRQEQAVSLNTLYKSYLPFLPY